MPIAQKWCWAIHCLKEARRHGALSSVTDKYFARSGSDMQLKEGLDTNAGSYLESTKASGMKANECKIALEEYRDVDIAR